jgi:hypothetical protein
MVVKLGLMLAAVCASIVNGAPFSPLFDPVLFLLRPALAPLPVSSDVLFYLASAYISVATLALAGIPAAIWERTRRIAESTPGSLAIWLLATLILALPGILGAAGYYEID